MSLTEWNPGPSATSPSPGSEAPPASPPGPPPPTTPSPARRLSRYLWPIVAVVVVIGVIISLVAAGVLNGGGGSPGGASPTFLAAYSVAQPSAGGVAGGPWSLVAAVGIDSATASTTNASGASSGNCSFTGVGGGALPTSLEIPAYHGSLSGGGSPFWGMIFVDRTTQQILLVTVIDGSAAPVAIGSGKCTSSFGNFTNVPSGIVDSSTAASAVWGDGGSAFVAAHSGLALNLEMALIGGGSILGLPIGPTWVLSYTPCGLSKTGPPGSQPEFEALVNAENGNVTLARATTTTCSSAATTPLGSVFAIGSPSLVSPPTSLVGCHPSDYCYEVGVEVAAGGLTPANVSFEVVTAYGTAVSGVSGFSILTITGQVLVSATGNPSTGWVAGTGTSQSPLSAGMIIVADVGTANPTGMGYVLQAQGLGSFSGTVVVSLP